VRQAAEDWLADGPDGRSAKTITTNRNVLQPVLAVIGRRKLRELSAADVRRALSEMATQYSSTTVTKGHLALKRAIRHAEAGDIIARNVAALADTPKGQPGRPCR
jgi:site-specific recombinase XerD